MSTPEPTRSDAIDDYLDQLLPLLVGRPGDVRRTLVETEDHLRESAAAEVAQGVDPERAARDAVTRFGAPRQVARRLRASSGGPSDVLLLAVARDALLLAGIGAVAVGLSGLVSEALGRIFGAGFVAGDAPGVTYTAERCAQFLRLSPATASCQAAAANDHWGEVVQFRVVFGVLGLVLLAVWGFWLRGRGPRPVSATLLPTVAVALFGLASVAFLGLSALQWWGGWTGGVGQWVSAGAVSVAFCLAFVPSLLRSLRAPLA